MKINYSWLKQYLSLDVDVEEIGKILPLIGHEVASVQTKGLPLLSNVVVGEVLRKEKHPNADKLGVCQVKVHPTEEPLQIVCGAHNYKVGDRVVVALSGSELPGGIKIKKSELRGVLSNGMMCARREIGFDSDEKGIMVLENRPEIGLPINEVLGKGECILDVELTANRGDCLSHIGIARELAAYYRKPIIVPTIHQKADLTQVNNSTKNSFLDSVKIESPDCYYYTAWSIQGVKINKSPDWLVQSLESVGLRSINNVVDITNYVMFELGQPLHAFDASKIKGKTLKVRQANSEEVLTTLDGKKRTLRPQDMVIADAERALVIAGVMGSVDAEVDDSTTDIILESAYFRPGAIRNTARYHGLSTDSSYRFERDIDPQSIVLAARRAIDLIVELAGGKLLPSSIEVGQLPPEYSTIDLSPDYIREVSGFHIEDTQIQDILTCLGFSIKVKENLTQNSSKKLWTVTVPSYRRDVARPIDLVEEVLRLHGTDQIPAARVTFSSVDREDDSISLLGQRWTSQLVGQGFQECINYTLRSGEEIKQGYTDQAFEGLAVHNPLASDQSHLRPSVIPGLLDNLKHNLSHGNDVRRLFEVGNVFAKNASEISEVFSIGFVMLAKPAVRLWQQPTEENFFSAKQVLQSICQLAKLPAKALKLQHAENKQAWQEHHAGTAGNLDREGYLVNVGLVSINRLKHWGIEELVYAGELLIKPRALKADSKAKKFVPFSVFPPVSKDLALVVDKNLPAAQVQSDLENIAQKCLSSEFDLEQLDIFDVYQGEGLPEGKKSLAFSLVFRAKDKTLTAETVNAVFEKIQTQLKADGRYAIRS